MNLSDVLRKLVRPIPTIRRLYKFKEMAIAAKRDLAAREKRLETLELELYGMRSDFQRVVDQLDQARRTLASSELAWAEAKRAHDQLVAEKERQQSLLERNLQQEHELSVARIGVLENKVEKHRSYLAEQVRLGAALVTSHFIESGLPLERKRVRFTEPGPLVSVVIPFFNETKLLRRSLGSVLSQCYKNLEVILIDDGSTEDVTEADALAGADPRVTILHEPNRKTGGARNFGMDLARGEYICFLDIDDWYMPGKITTQVRLMQQHEALWSHTSYFAVYPSRGLGPTICASGEVLNGHVFPRIIDNCWISSCTLMLHQAIVREGYRYPLLTGGGEDTVLFCEIASKYPILGINFPLTVVELDDESTVCNVRKYLAGLTNVRDQFRAHPMLSQFPEKIAVLDAEVARLAELSATNRSDDSLISGMFDG